MGRMLDWILADRPTSYLAALREGETRPDREKDRVLFSHLAAGPTEGPLLAGLRSTPEITHRGESQRRWFARPALTPVAWTLEEAVLLTGLAAALLLVVAPFAGPSAFAVDLPAIWNATVDLQASGNTPEAYLALQDAASQGGVLSQAAGKLGLLFAL